MLPHDWMKTTTSERIDVEGVLRTLTARWGEFELCSRAEVQAKLLADFRRDVQRLAKLARALPLLDARGDAPAPERARQTDDPLPLPLPRTWVVRDEPAGVSPAIVVEDDGEA